MTCDSIDSRPMRVRRPNSRSTSLRASSGSSSASSFARSSSSSRRLVALAELLLDRLELLAQEHLALAVAELLLDLALDVLLRVEHVDLALHVHAARGAAAPRPRASRAAPGAAAARRRGSRPPGRRSGRARRRSPSTCSTTSSGRPELLPSSAARARSLAVQRHERRIVRVERRHLLGVAHDRRRGGRPSRRSAPRCRGARRGGAAACRRGRAAAGRCGRWCRWCRASRESTLLHVLPLGHREDQLLRGGQRGLDRLEGTGPSGADRRGDSGESTTSRSGRTGSVRRSVMD